ncbi:VanZ family protein [Jeotgalibacillus soli]|uniref:VanZ-like domain-containing protein n=1 Tax=Jeotgalibacillus soli TaxID=889306 RepID=A0A0C2VZG9_9BACL|nr:VanZ family protein [Jeotgalibacillus soli]KIL49781.1 hypothetical protein KP78_12490 [Jeotgalibacillus soli]
MSQKILLSTIKWKVFMLQFLYLVMIDDERKSFMRQLIKVTLTILPFLYMALIWLFSSLPHNAVMELPSSSADRFIKEALHVVEFGLLHLLFVLALLANGRLSDTTHIFAAVFAGFYGLLDEIHQAFVPSRSATVIDAIKDLTGVIIAYLVIKHTCFFGFDRRLGRLLHSFQRWVR